MYTNTHANTTTTPKSLPHFPYYILSPLPLLLPPIGYMPPSIYQWTSTNPNPSPNPNSNSTNTPMISHSQQQDEDRPLHEWDFQPATAVSPAAAPEAPDVLGAIEFDPSDRLLATGGIARKIRIYSVASLLSGQEGPACNFYICTPAKLSSLRWKPLSGAAGPVGAGDYDGVVTEYDVERRVPVFERDEHGGRRVWSVDYAPWAPHVGASGSDDGTAQLWDSRCPPASSAGAVLRPAGSGAPVCSAEFDRSADTRVGLGCADTNAYVYDVRAVARPLSVLGSHRRTVTYVRFGGDGRVVTASTDGTIKMWNGVEPVELRTFKGHVNMRSFVGLSVWWTGGLIGCGSESDEVYAYDMRWSEPVWVKGLGGGDDCDSDDDKNTNRRRDRRRGFVSAVAWRQKADSDGECVVVAGGTNGALQAWVGKKRRYPCII